MRLEVSEVLAIILAIENNIICENLELRLYGSRVDVKAKGGDIDLLLLLNNEVTYDQAILKKYDILVDLKSSLGEQKN